MIKLISMRREFTYSINNQEYLVKVHYLVTRRIRYVYRKDGFHISCPYLTLKATLIKGLDRYAEGLIKTYKSTLGYDDTHMYILGMNIDISNRDSLSFNNGITIKFKDIESLRKALKVPFLKIVTERVRHYEQVMNTKRHNIRVRDMRTRLGTNSKKTNTITIALNLVHYNVDIIDSVIIHELAHDYYFDHSKKFYNVVYKYCPNYDKLRKHILKGRFNG